MSKDLSRSNKRQLDPKAAEAIPLAKKFASAFEGFIQFYQDTYNLSRSEARRRAKAGIKWVQRVKAQSPDQITWISLGQVSQHDPEAGIEAWNRLRDGAQDELESGHRAAKVVSKGFDFGPLERARFLVVRQALFEEWDPSPGSEVFLIDSLAQIQTAWEMWLSKHIHQVAMGDGDTHAAREKREGGGWLPGRVHEAEALQLSASMADRFNKMYIRTLRALRDLRRMAPPVVVQNAGQVNVGQQQVNVTAAETIV